VHNRKPRNQVSKDTDGDENLIHLDTQSNGITWDISNNNLIMTIKHWIWNNDGIIDGKTDLDKDGIQML
jgi:hypothetical protein